MIEFELFMPGIKAGYYKMMKREYDVPKDIVGKEFEYTFPTGEQAKVKVIRKGTDDPEYDRLLMSNHGFCGFEWMVDSIIKNKAILPDS